MGGEVERLAGDVAATYSHMDLFLVERFKPIPPNKTGCYVLALPIPNHMPCTFGFGFMETSYQVDITFSRHGGGVLSKKRVKLELPLVVKLPKGTLGGLED